MKIIHIHKIAMNINDLMPMKTFGTYKCSADISYYYKYMACATAFQCCKL